MKHDLPTILNNTYGGVSSYNLASDCETTTSSTALKAIRAHQFRAALAGRGDTYEQEPFEQEEYQQPNYMTKRIVRVYLADTDENVPLSGSVLHSTQEKLTDLTDQELFFEIPIQDVLTKHNALRVTLLDKKQTARSGRDTFLEPVKIRDLKMTVVTVASF